LFAFILVPGCLLKTYGVLRFVPRNRRDEIRLRAYEIYLEPGGLPGDEINDWLQAERELSRPIPHEAESTAVEGR